MPTYQCDLCNYKTKIKTHFNRHINTPKHKKKYLDSKLVECCHIEKEDLCTEYEVSQKEVVKTGKLELDIKLIEQNDSESNTINNPKVINKYKPGFTCELCGKTLSSKGHLNRHKRSFCKEIKTKKESIILKDMLEEQQQQFANERSALYKQIEKLLDKVGNTTNIQSNIKNTINLNSYGSENMSHITDQLKTQLVKIPYVMIPKLIEAVHFNDNHPENKNIALTNSRDNKIKVYSDNKWIYKDKEETINDLVDEKYYILDTHYDQVNDSLENNCKTNFVKFKEYLTSEDKEFVTKLKRECELVLLNNR
jgi:hypothetical protein